jgi:Tfp pilus assembly protein PilF
VRFAPVPSAFPILHPIYLPLAGKSGIFDADVRLENILDMRLRILTHVFVISILIISSCSKDESASRMPVTTDSDLARELYETGMLAFDQIKFDLAFHNLELAVKEDPDFFMAEFWLYFMSREGPKKVAEMALNSEADLSDGEKQIKSAFKYLVDGDYEKVVEHLNKAIDLYPEDPSIHKILYLLQFQYLRDVEGAVKSMKRAIKAQPGYPPVYNQLGYALMELGDFEGAEDAFNTYIRLAPDIANPYDSKGDYFMKTDHYAEAYESYLRAYEIDSGFTVSEKKARRAKQLMEKSLSE